MCTSYIRRHVFSLARGKLFTTRDFLSYGSRSAVDQALSRLTRAGLIVRLARGVFVREGSPVPSAFEVAAAKASAFGKTIAAHAADLALALGFAVVENREPTFAVSGRSSSFGFGDTRIHLKGACSRFGRRERDEVNRSARWMPTWLNDQLSHRPPAWSAWGELAL